MPPLRAVHLPLSRPVGLRPGSASLALALALGLNLGLPRPVAADEAKPPSVPLAERNHIEVAGQWYPVFEYPKEAEPTFDPRPRLPRKAQKEGRGGLVLLGVLVSREGRVLDTAIAMTNTEADIQQAAVSTIRRWEFPIKRDDAGRPIDYAVMIPVRFDATPHFDPQ